MALVDRCKLCGSQRIRPRYELERYALTVVECDVCRLTFVGDDLSDEQIDGLYAESGLADYFVALEKRHEHKFEPRLRELPRVGVAPGARVLDVGCGSGEFPELAKAAGYDAVGLDVSQPSISAARELHPDVEYRLAGADELAAAEPASFDLVTLWDVIEHVKYPHDVVAACAALVRPGGLVACGTQNGDSLYARVADAAYSTIPPVGKLMLMQRYSQWHLQIWTTATLSRLVRDHGLDIAWTRKHRDDRNAEPLPETAAVHPPRGPCTALGRRNRGAATDPEQADALRAQAGDGLGGGLGRAGAEQRVVDGLDGARVDARIEMKPCVLRRRIPERLPQLRVLDQQPQRRRDALRARVVEQQPRLAGYEHACTVARAGGDDPLAVHRCLEHRPAEADALVRERDDVERRIDLAGLRRERQE